MRAVTFCALALFSSLAGAADVLEHVRNFVLRRAHAVIAISRQINDELLKRGVNPAKIVPLPNGVSMRKFRPVPRADRRPGSGSGSTAGDPAVSPESGARRFRSRRARGPDR